MERLKGRYSRKQGEKRHYDYFARYKMTPGGFIWEATVRCAEDLKGSTAGHVSTEAYEHVEIIVRSMVEGAIENLVGLEE